MSLGRSIFVLGLAVATGLVWLLGWDETAAAWVRPWSNDSSGIWWGRTAYWAGLGGAQLGALALAAIWSRLKGPGWLWRVSLTGAAGVAAAGLLTQAVKHLVGRPRPRMDLPVWEYFGPTLQSDWHSFPSGHAATSFALAAVLGERWPSLAWLFHMLAAMVCAGRVISGSHHLSDVMGGAVLGLALGWPLARRFTARDGGES